MRAQERRGAGELLKNWRHLRGMSQIELAVHVGTSAKSLSFLENGRSIPSHDLLERICLTLGLDARSRDLVLRSAGYSQTYAAPDLEEGEMARLKHALECTVRKLEPCPAIVFDRETNLITSNAMSMRLLHWLARDTPLYQAGVTNMSELTLSNDGLRPFMRNWPEVAKRTLDRMYREIAVEDVDGSLTQTYQRWLSIEGIPKEWAQPPTETAEPIMLFCFEKDRQEIILESMVFTIGTPTDLNYQEIRIRCWIPADEPTRRFLEALGAAGPDLEVAGD